MCICVAHPISERSIHRHQAVFPGTYVTLVVTVWWQYGQRTRPGLSLRYGTEMGTGGGWVTTTTGWVCLPFTVGVTPTGKQKVYKGSK